MARSTVLRWLLGSMLVTAVWASSSLGVCADEPIPRSFKPSLLTFQAPRARVGQAVAVPVVFRAEPGWLIDKDFPLHGKLFPPEGVTAEKQLFRNADVVFAPHEGRLDVVLTPHAVGKKIAAAALAFGVYKGSGTERDIKIVQVRIAMDVE